MKKASITLYLCLILSVLLSLIAVSFYSARIAAGRAMLACSLEEGMFSLFGEYDSELFERYGLMFLDGGRGTSSLRLHKLTDRTEQYASYIVNPGRDTGGNVPVAMTVPAASITGYVLATDGGGEAFRRQVCTAMKGRLVGNAARNALRLSQETQNLAETQRSEMQENLSDDTVTESEQAAADAIDLGPDYSDPRDSVAAARRMGIMNLVIPAGRTVSAGTVNLSDLPSGRSLQRGIGGIAVSKKGLADHALLMEYAVEMFHCFTSADETDQSGLQYQLEYLLCGKGSDAENLKGTLNRLMLMREASNLAFLTANPGKRSESLAAATTVAGLLGVPYLAPLIAVGIRAAWAYAEGVLDLRRLLNGEKVSLVKTEENWQLSISQLPVFLNSSESGGEEDSDGLDYEGYLRLLLMIKSDTDLTKGLMDLVEDTMRHTEGKSSFRIDNCIDAMSMELAVTAEGRELKTYEQYGYGMN
ncbi:MAG: hypothetical protein IJI10_03485 [Eubacterium sp.]|nr:hypothetical protein [Eubacterium sp.]